VLVDQERCRGYRKCMEACPYKKTLYRGTTRTTERQPRSFSFPVFILAIALAIFATTAIILGFWNSHAPELTAQEKAQNAIILAMVNKPASQQQPVTVNVEPPVNNITNNGQTADATKTSPSTKRLSATVNAYQCDNGSDGDVWLSIYGIAKNGYYELVTTSSEANNWIYANGSKYQADAHGKGAKAVGEIDHGFTDWRMDLVGAAADHERAIELHFRERQFLQLHQGRTAFAEVVDCEPHIVLGECPAQLVGERDLAQDLLLGDVDHQAGPVVHLRMVIAHDLADRQLDQAFHRDVDRDPQVDVEPRQVQPGLKRFYQRPLGQCQYARLVGRQAAFDAQS